MQNCHSTDGAEILSFTSVGFNLVIGNWEVSGPIFFLEFPKISYLSSARYALKIIIDILVGRKKTLAMRRKRDAKKADVEVVEAEVEATAEGILFQLKFQ